MRLLVSVRDAREAEVATAAGADVIDAKDPTRGPMAPVAAADLEAIATAVARRRPVSAALGDFASGHSAVEAAARLAGRSGVAIVKLGINPGSPAEMVGECLDVLDVLRKSARPGAATALVLGAYADAPADARYPYAVLDAATQCGAAGVLLDTVNKGGRSLFDVMPAGAIAAWTAAAHSAGLSVALAGSLGLADVAPARDSGADFMGVRGAVCSGGRSGTLVPERVRALVDAMVGVPSPPTRGRRKRSMRTRSID